MNKNIVISIILILLATIYASHYTIAVNDPGHDTLYIEEQGDSELNGTFNVTQNQTIKGGELNLFNNFLLLSTGVVPSSYNSILSNNGNYISINAYNTGAKVVKLNDQVANGYVLIGDSGGSVQLNITGNTTIQGSLLDMQNLKIKTDGTYSEATYNVLATTGTASNREFFITTQKLYLARGSTNGIVYVGYADDSDSVDLNITGNLYVQGSTAKVNNINICLQDGTNCPTGATSSANITGSGTSNYLAKWDNSSNLGSSAIYQNGSNIGIGTTTPGSKLHVIGRANITNDLYVTNEIRYYEADGSNVRFKMNGANALVGSYCPNGDGGLCTDNVFNITSHFSAQNIDGGKVTASYITTNYVEADNPETEQSLYIRTSNYTCGVKGCSYTNLPRIIITNNQTIATVYINNSNMDLLGYNLSNANYINATNIYQNGSQVCTASNGLCSSGSSGNITGSGTANYYALWNNGTHLVTGNIKDITGGINVTGNITMPLSFFIGKDAQVSGKNSLAIGSGAKAQGENDIAIGYNAYTPLSGTTNNIAIGRYANASSTSAVSIGFSSRAINEYSIALGSASATGLYSLAEGYMAKAPGQISIAIGSSAYGEGYDSIALGSASNASKDDSIAIGSSAKANHLDSIALGSNARTSATHQLIIGNSTNNKMDTIISGNLTVQGPTATVNGGNICTDTNGLCDQGNIVRGLGTADRIAFWNGSSSITSNGNLTWVDSSKRLGIGTANPGYPLTVKTATDNYGMVQTDGTASLSTYVSSSGQYIGGWIGTISQHPLKLFVANNDSSLTINSSTRYVGINTDYPTQWLEVNGSLNVSNGNIYASGTGYLGGSQVCTVANGLCSSENITGSGTANYYALWNNGTHLVTGNIKDIPGGINVTGNITMPSAFFIGEEATVSSIQSMAIGYRAKSGAYATAIGYLSNASLNYDTSVGYKAKAGNGRGTTIGAQTQASAYATAVGYSAKASSASSVAIGNDADATNTEAIAIGRSAQSIGNNAVAIGGGASNTLAANANSQQSIAIGYASDATGTGSTAIGASAKVSGNYATVLGYGANVSSNAGIALGFFSKALNTNSIAIGQYAITNASNQIMIGNTPTYPLNMYLTGNLTVVGSNGILGGSQICTVANGLCNQSSSDTVWSLTGDYLYNNSGSLDLNETKLNATIDARGTANGYLTSVPYQNSSAGWTNTSTTTSTGLDVNITSRAAGTVPLTIHAVNSQTGNLTEWQDKNGKTLTMIDSSGNIRVANDIKYGTIPNSGNYWYFKPFSTTPSHFSQYVQEFNIYGYQGRGWEFNDRSTNRLWIDSLSGDVGMTGALNITGGNATKVQLAIKGAASQSANLQEWQNSSGSALSYIDSTGNLFVGNLKFHQDSNTIDTSSSDLIYFNTVGSSRLVLQSSMTYPYTNNSMKLGTTSKRWSEVNTILLNASGNVYDNGNRVCTASNGLCNQSFTDTLQTVTDRGTTTTHALSIDSNGDEQTNITGALKVGENSAFGNNPSENYRLYVYDQATANNQANLRPLQMSGNYNGTHNIFYYGYANPTSGTVSTYDNMYGYGFISPSAGATVTTFYNQHNIVRALGNGAETTKAYNNYNSISTDANSMNISKAYNYYSAMSAGTNTSITSAYAFFAGTPTANGNITNEYGLYVADQNTADTNNYAIYTGLGDARFGDSVEIDNGISSKVPLTVKGAASQSANLQEWQDSSGTTLSKMDEHGYFKPGECAGSYAEGDLCYNSTSHQMCYYNSTSLNCW